MAENAPAVDVAPTEELTPVETRRPTQDLLDEGSKLLATKKFDEAAETFSKAVEQLTEQHGELAPEVADALVLYGKALLRYAVSRSGVLGGPTGKPAGQEAAPAEPAAPVAGPSTAPAGRNFHFGGDDPAEEQGEEEEEAEAQPEEDPEDDLETAFGVLDTAKVILQKLEGRESKLKLAEVHDTLGEVLTESEKFEDAAVEYEASLSILQGLLEPHDRRIAEAHLMVALALEYAPNEPEKARKRALEYAQNSRSVLQLKLEQLRGTGNASDHAEIKDIEEVLVDLDMKIDDLKNSPIFDAQSEKDKALAEALGKPQLDASAPHNDLSGLVKKKKKPVAPQEGVAPAPAVMQPNGAALNGASTSEAPKRKVEELLNGAAIAAPAGGQATVVVGGTTEAHEQISKRARIDPASSP